MKTIGAKEMAEFEAALRLAGEQMDELQKLNAAAAAATLNTAASGNPVGAIVGGTTMLSGLTANYEESMARFQKAALAFLGEQPRPEENHAEFVWRIGNLGAEGIIALMRSNGIRFRNS